MNILEIYKKYLIMPQLMEHQLRVAGVAKVILENFNTSPATPAFGGPSSGRRGIITACLLHDMGNIIKFDLSIVDKFFPGKFTKQDMDYWQKVKENFVAKYGNDEHQASVQIAKEVGAKDRIIELVDCIGFDKGEDNAKTEDFAKKICAYSDMRVGLNGVIPLEVRLADLRVRYDFKHKLMGGNENLRLEFEAELREIEKQIFLQSRIKPEEITEEMVGQEIENLKNFEI